MKNLITNYKEKIITSIVNSPTLVALINPEHIPDEKPGAATGLINTQVFPYFYLDTTCKESNVYVCMRINIQKKDDLCNKVRISIYAIAHKDKLSPTQTGTRIDKMAEELETLFVGRDDFGFLPLEMMANQEKNVYDVYRLRELIFETEDFIDKAKHYE